MKHSPFDATISALVEETSALGAATSVLARSYDCNDMQCHEIAMKRHARTCNAMKRHARTCNAMTCNDMQCNTMTLTCNDIDMQWHDMQ